MEQPCHKCGASVEDGVAFCRHCGAPQIRVVKVEPGPPAPIPSPAVPAEDEQPRFAQVSLPVRAAGVQWSQALPGAALAGAFSLLLAIVPFAVFGPAFLVGGALAVFLYRRQSKDRLPTPGEGGRVGAASGGFGFLFFAIMTVATLVYRPEEMRTGMLESMSQLAARGYDAHKVQQVQELLKTSQGLAVLVAFGLVVIGLMFVIGSSIGGALYAAWLRKREQR